MYFYNMFTIVNFSKLLLVIGGIAWGIYGAFQINIIKRIFPTKEIQQFVYITYGLAALFLMFNRNFYLPFLGKTVVPLSFIKDNQSPHGATFHVVVKVAPNARVIYWAAEPLKDKESNKRCVKVAYGEFKNSGITTADANGKAHLVLRKPDKYTIDKKIFRKTMGAHIHYRYALSDGMMSRIFTKKIYKRKSNKSKSNKNSSESPRQSVSDKNSSESSRQSPKSKLDKNSSESPKLQSPKRVVHAPGAVEKYSNDEDLEIVLKDRDIQNNVNSMPQNLYENDYEMFNDLYSTV